MKIPMTAPVVTWNKGEGKYAMQFILPESKFLSASDAPKPLNENVRVVPLPERTLATYTFTWLTSLSKCTKQVHYLREALDNDDIKYADSFQLFQYNSPWTIPFLRTNEVAIPVDYKSD